MDSNRRSNHGIRIWIPDTLPAECSLGHAVADCLAAAFGSGVWARSPMPVGDRSTPHSARGILAELGAGTQILLASTDDHRPHNESDVLGCVLGSVLDEELIRAYGLGSFGAQCGDGLLAFIGLHPAAQGTRVIPRANNCFDLAPAADHPVKSGGISLASLLFSCWLELPEVTRCRRVYVRTRSVLPKIQHLAAKSGFVYQGRFELEFQGERQDRIVYSRINTQTVQEPLPLAA